MLPCSLDCLYAFSIPLLSFSHLRFTSDFQCPWLCAGSKRICTRRNSPLLTMGATGEKQDKQRASPHRPPWSRGSFILKSQILLWLILPCEIVLLPLTLSLRFFSFPSPSHTERKEVSGQKLLAVCDYGIGRRKMLWGEGAHVKAGVSLDQLAAFKLFLLGAPSWAIIKHLGTLKESYSYSTSSVMMPWVPTLTD